MHSRCAIFCAVVGSLLLMGGLCGAQAENSAIRMGVPHDWTHHHVVFSRGADQDKNAEALISDLRLWHQVLRTAPTRMAQRRTRPRRRKVDWSVNLGAPSSMLAPGAYPAKYTFDINASPSCTNDFVVFALDIAGSGTQATIVAYNNLYVGSPSGICAGTLPTVKWSYNTGGAVNTSPVLSLDGKKVAWIANANPPVLHVLTIGITGSNGTAVTSPAVAGTGNNALDTTRTFGTVGDTRSSLFVDYGNDVGYVASDDGNIHKFTGIFNGTPTEVMTGGWPFLGQDGANHVLTSPVYDSVSKNIFYGSDAGTLAYIRETGSTVGACSNSAATPPCLGLNFYSLGGAIIEGPLVDSAAQNVFAFVGNNGASHAVVQQADTQLSSNGPQAAIGENGGNLFAGTFDNNYFTSPSTGFLYVCGYPTSGTASPVLYRIGFNANNNMKTATDGNSLSLSSAATTCSPMTEIFNPPTLKDWLFVSVENGCVATGGGSGGCVMSFDITSGFPSAATQGRSETGGTSGIVVDNVSTSAQASSIYFTSQGIQSCSDGVSTSGCAVKMTQSGLN